MNGGGLYFDSSAFPSGDVTLTIRDSVIEDNHSNSSGGGISLSNSTINLSNSHKLKIDILSSTIQNNSAYGAVEEFYGLNVRGGGGIYVDVDGNNVNSEGVVFNLTDSTVSENIAQRGEGGGVWFVQSTGVLLTPSTAPFLAIARKMLLLLPKEADYGFRVTITTKNLKC